jgi:hypothetical protein
MSAQGARIILAFLGLPSKLHDEQCTVAEYSAYIARDVIAHIDIAAEARIKKPRPNVDEVDSDEDTDGEDAPIRARRTIELVDLGGGDNDHTDGFDHDVPPSEVSNFPLRDVVKTVSLCFQHGDIASLESKQRKSQSDLDLKHMDDIYSSCLKQSFAMAGTTVASNVRGFGAQHTNMVALQKKTLALAKKHQGGDDNEGIGEQI